MASFKDTAGDEWQLEITGATIKRAQKLLGIDLGDLSSGTPPLLTRLATDVAFLVDVLYVACLPQAESRGIDDLGFADRLGGQTLSDAEQALVEGLRDFFRPLKKTFQIAALERQQATIRKADRRAAEVTLGPEMDAAIDAQIAQNVRVPGSSAASLPRSPAVNPSQEPSGS